MKSEKDMKNNSKQASAPKTAGAPVQPSNPIKATPAPARPTSAAASSLTASTPSKAAPLNPLTLPAAASKPAPLPNKQEKTVPAPAAATSAKPAEPTRTMPAAATKPQNTPATPPTSATSSKPQSAPSKAMSPAAPVEKTGTKPTASVKAAQKITTIEAKIDVGFGNSLYLRGQGPGLSWDKGVPLTCLDGKTWRWTGPSSDKLIFKLLLNDTIWAKGEDAVVVPGGKVQVAPEF